MPETNGSTKTRRQQQRAVETRAALLDKLGDDVDLRIETTGQIARDGSGKLHFCRSEIRP